MKQLFILALVSTAVFGSTLGTIRTTAVYTMSFPSQYSEIESELGLNSNSVSSQSECLALAMINGYNPNLPESETNWIDCNFKN